MALSTFYTVSTGNTVAAADPNQYANILNGSTNGAILVVNAAGSQVPVQTQLATAPTSDGGVVVGGVTGDSTNRIILYIRGSDGYGALEAGAGSSITARLYAQSTGWKTDQSLTVGNNLSVTNNVTCNTLNIGSTAINNGNVNASTGSVTGNTLVANSASGNPIYGTAQFSGTGSGTYTHGLSASPNAVSLIQNVSNSTTTVGVDSIGSSTLHANINGSFAFLGWVVKN